MELQPLNKNISESKASYYPVYEKKRSWFSSLLLLWIHPLLRIAHSTKLEQEHTFDLPDTEKAESETLSHYLKNHKLMSALFRSHWKKLLLVIILGNITSMLDYAAPIYIQLLISYLGSDNKPLETGLILAGSYSIITLSQQIINGQWAMQSKLIEIRVRNSLASVIYNKITITSTVEEGQGVNLLQVDAKNIVELFAYSGWVVAMPFQIGLAIFLILQQVSTAVFAGIGAIVLALSLNYFIAIKCKNYQEKYMKIRDERIENSKNLFGEIKMIKVYSWEEYFKNRVNAVRQKEISTLRVLNFFYATNIFLLWTIPSLTAVIVFVFYTQVLGEHLNSEKTFVTLTALLLLQEPFRSLPQAVTKIFQCYVSSKRIQKLLDSPIVEKLNKNDVIVIENATFAYGEKEILHDIDLAINKGELLAIIGEVGSGKSSILNAIMGEIKIKSGKIAVDDNIAYAPSLDSWVMNGTLRNNILFGKEFDENKYWKVIEACCLMQDINILPARDSTEIGEKGINLSGGQKARVCLARAVYADRDIYLLDDPLSSVDSHVANHIFKHCILGLLGNKTRILATHRMNILQKCDRVLIMEEGKIKKITTSENISVDTEITEEESKKVEAATGEGKLIGDEDREVGKVSLDVYKDYLKCAGAYYWIGLAIFAMIIYTGVRMAGDIFLKNWSENQDETSTWMPLYFSFRLGSCIFVYIRTLSLNVTMQINTGKKVHENLISSLIRAPINLFYDITPLGRILNRLSKDIGIIEEDLGFTIGTLLSQTCSASASLIMVFIYFPWLALLVPFSIYPALKLKEYYISTSRELTRLEAISRSPILNNYTETISGAKFIRVHDKIPYFINKNNGILNTNARMSYSLAGCSAWLDLYLGFLSSAFICVLFFLVVIYRNEVTVGVVGLSLAYIVSLPRDVSSWVMTFATLENQMVSVERTRHFTKLDPEQPLKLDTDKNLQNWPISPSIKFRDAKMRYRPNTDLVLNGVNFIVEPGQRIGLVGRTGCGKSSLFLCLLRIVELESGAILIDEVNIAHIGLSVLRGAITLIAQDPLVFEGTLKDNLDPGNVKSQAQIEKALNEVKLSKFPIDHAVKAKGSNLSIGERQLLSLGRAMLADTKIILFDEATAGIDPETDSQIQELIKDKFPGKTLLAIAHRIGTIMDSDAVIVMDRGEVKEIGNPKELVEKDSLFKRLAQNIH